MTNFVERAIREHRFREHAARAMQPSTCKRKPLPWWKRLLGLK